MIPTKADNMAQKTDIQTFFCPNTLFPTDPVNPFSHKSLILKFKFPALVYDSLKLNKFVKKYGTRFRRI